MPFKPDELTAEGELKVPYFASQGKEIPGRGTHKSQKQLQEEIRALMMRVGAGMVEFKAGHWEESDRYGFQVEFSLNGHPGRLECAALPIRSVTEIRKDRALAQALYWLRDWLQGEINSRLFRPGAVALLPFLVDENGRTVTELYIEKVGEEHLRGLYLPAPK